MIVAGKTEMHSTCDHCKTRYAIMADPADVVAWQDGKLIQDAMPYLSKEDRELLISGTCGDCFSAMFGDCFCHE